MIPKELLKKIRHIEIRTTRLVNDLFGGEYESVFKGQGIEFADVREYVPGDDIRTIDWNVTARSEKPFVKKFVEERELTVLFIVDMSGSQYFGTGTKLKAEIAAEITALLAFAAVKNKDKTGLLTVTEDVEKYIPIKKGRNHVLRVIREILYYKPQHSKTNLAKAFEYLQKFLTRTAVIFVISDFLDDGFQKSLKMLSRRHDVIPIHLKDPKEVTLPTCGLVELVDAENGIRQLVDMGDKPMRQAFESNRKQHDEKLRLLFRSLKMDSIDILSTESYVEPIMKFFKLREKRI